MNLRPNDLAIVHRAPDSTAAKVPFRLGQVGLIERLSDDGRRAFFQGLELPGRLTRAMGWIPIDCLRPVDDPVWQAALTEYQRWFAELVLQEEERERRWNRQIEMVSKRYGLTPKQVLEIADAVWIAPPDPPSPGKGPS